MRYRHYHIPLEEVPEWGPASGFGLDDCLFEWVQQATWWQMIVTHFGGVLTVNGEPTPFPRHSLLIVPPLARCSLERATDENITQFWMKFRPNPASELKMSVPQVSPLGTEFEYLDRMLRLGLDMIPNTRARLTAVTNHLLWSVSSSIVSSPEEPEIAKVEAYIKANLAAPLEASDLAAISELSVAKLNRMFKQHCNQSLVEYVRTQRMQLACVLLKQTDRPIKEIALIVGYPNPQRFNKVVRETFGCSPRSLRTDRPTLDVNTVSNTPHYQDLAVLQSNRPRR